METVDSLANRYLHRLPCLGYASAPAPKDGILGRKADFAESLEARAVCMANDNLGN